MLLLIHHHLNLFQHLFESSTLYQYYSFWLSFPTLTTLMVCFLFSPFSTLPLPSFLLFFLALVIPSHPRFSSSFFFLLCSVFGLCSLAEVRDFRVGVGGFCRFLLLSYLFSTHSCQLLSLRFLFLWSHPLSSHNRRGTSSILPSSFLLLLT
jgi:hypothetical protein